MIKPTDTYIRNKINILLKRNYEQLVNHEAAQSYYLDTPQQEILNTYHPVSKDVCANLPVGGVGVLGVEAPPILLRPGYKSAVPATEIVVLRTDEPSAPIGFDPLDDEMSERSS
jgi:hypothetical protein